MKSARRKDTAPSSKRPTWEDLINPTDKQRQCIETFFKYDFTLYGGAAGGGKSYILRWILALYLYWLFNEFGLRNVQVALFCEDYPSLFDRHISKIKFEFPREIGELKHIEGTLNFVLLPELGGGSIALRNLDDPSKYLSAEFAAIAVDELTRNTKKVFDFLRSRLRWPGVARPKFLGGTNPGGQGHDWVKKLWIDKEFPREMETLKDQFAFVQAKASDNKHLPDTYYQNLLTLPTAMAQAYAEGSWDTFSGQYFTNWYEPTHVWDMAEIPFQPYWPRWISIDWGFQHSTAVYWHTQAGVLESEDGKPRPLVVTYKEYVRSGLSERALAEEIVAVNDGDKIEAIYGGHDLWAKQSHGATKEQAMSQVFRAAGLPGMVQAKIDRVNGWRLMHLMLDEGRWIVTRNCKQAISAIPTAIFDDKKQNEDILKTSDVQDDIRDCLRYGLYSQYGPADIPFEQKIMQKVAHLTDQTNRHIHMTKLLSEHERSIGARGLVNSRSGARAGRYSR